MHVSWKNKPRIIDELAMPTKAPIAIIPIISLLLSVTMWGILWYPLRVLESYGVPGLWTTLLFYGAAFLVGLCVVFWLRQGVRGSLPDLLIMACASGWTNVAFILAIIEGNVVRIMLLFYLSPLWTVILGRLVLGEVLSRSAQFTMFLAMVGAVIMLWNDQAGMPWPQDRADWLAITSGFSFALSNVLVRKIQDETLWVKTVFAWAGVVLLAVAWLVIGEYSWPTASSMVLTTAFVFGGLSMMVMTLLVLYGLTHMPAHQAAIILLFELVVAAVSAQILTDETVLRNEWLGGAIILLAGCLAAYRQVNDKAG